MMVNIVPQDSIYRAFLSSTLRFAPFCLPSIPHCAPSLQDLRRSWRAYKARDHGNIYTVTFQTQTLTGKQWNACLFEGRWGGIGFVCFRTVVLALVPPPTGIHCCLFGHQLTPLTFPNGWLIPVKATVGAPGCDSSNVASLWTCWRTPPNLHIKAWWQVLVRAPVQRKKVVKGRLLRQGTWNKDSSDITLILVKTLTQYDKSVTVSKFLQSNSVFLSFI